MHAIDASFLLENASCFRDMDEYVVARRPLGSSNKRGFSVIVISHEGIPTARRCAGIAI